MMNFHGYNFSVNMYGFSIHYLDRRSLNKWVQKKSENLAVFFSILMSEHKN